MFWDIYVHTCAYIPATQAMKERGHEFEMEQGEIHRRVWRKEREVEKYVYNIISKIK